MFHRKIMSHLPCSIDFVQLTNETRELSPVTHKKSIKKYFLISEKSKGIKNLLVE